MGGLAFTLRLARVEDEAFLARLYGDTRREEVAAWGWPPQQQESFLRMQFEAQRRSYRAAFPGAADRIVLVENADAGRILVAEQPEAMHLVDISLLEEFRNRGLGTELLLGLQRECRARQNPLRLEVRAGNPAARLYRRLGFAVIDADAMYARMEWLPAPAPEGL